LVVPIVGASALALAGSAFAGPSVVGAKPKPGHVKTLKGKTYAEGIACPKGKAPAKETCVVPGTTSTASNTLSLIHKGVPKSTTTVSPGGLAPTCPTATVCVLAGASTSGGTLEWFASGVAGSTSTVSGADNLLGVACTSATKCVGVGYHNGAETPTGEIQNGEIAIVTDGSNATAKRIPGMSEVTGVACPTSTMCVAVGTKGNFKHAALVTIKKGKIGKARVVHGSAQLANVACGSKTTCWATGYSVSKKGDVDVAVRIAKGKPGHPVLIGHSGSAISCVSATTCYVAGGTKGSAKDKGPGLVTRLVKGHVKASVRIKHVVIFSGIACPVATSCIATGPSKFHGNGVWSSAVVTIKV
jgi:hypothetical protein